MQIKKVKIEWSDESWGRCLRMSCPECDSRLVGIEKDGIYKCHHPFGECDVWFRVTIDKDMKEHWENTRAAYQKAIKDSYNK